MKITEYICSLDDVTREKALNELGETDNVRKKELDSLHVWVLGQTDLTCPTDPLFLLRYLRASKFNQAKARERLINHMTIYRRHRDWFGRIDPLDPAVRAVLDSSHVLYLPGFDDGGQKVILYRLGSFNPDSEEYDKAAIIRTFTAIFLHQIQNEAIQVNGFVYLLDASDFVLRQQLFWSVRDLMLIAKLWQNAMPCRFKAFHFYNIGFVFEVIFKMLMPFLSKKFRERIFVHRTMDTVYNHVPMRLLPLEYVPATYDGPNAGSLSSLVEITKEQISDQSTRERLLYETGDNMGRTES